uniref:MADF domain-containing protein n=1 Tax=Anopheles minimus TaxID=112268 RepID=A0A182WAZ5_9DIPT
MGNEETLIFIDHIFRRRSLWDRKSSHYKNVIIKADMWNEIAAEMGYPVQNMKDRWSSLQATYRKYRSNYNRSFLTGSGAEEIAQPTWFAYSNMRFLDATTECGVTLNTMSHLEIEMLDEAYVPGVEPVLSEATGVREDPACLLLPEVFGTSTPTLGPSQPSSTRQAAAHRPTNRKRKQDGSMKYTEEALEALRTVGAATMSLIDRLNAPSDDLDDARDTIRTWSPERRRRFLVRVRRMITEEEENRFRGDFGYNA